MHSVYSPKSVLASGIDVAASIRENFRQNLARILEERGTKQRDLAEALGVDPVVITFWKKGNRFPEAKQIDRLIEALGVEPEELFQDPAKAAIAPRLDKQQAESLSEFAKAIDAVRQFAKSAGYDLIKKS